MYELHGKDIKVLLSSKGKWIFFVYSILSSTPQNLELVHNGIKKNDYFKLALKTFEQNHTLAWSSFSTEGCT